jgi:hypothetical protein
MKPRSLPDSQSVVADAPLAVLEVGGHEAAAVAVWWVGVHGGAGESTLEALFAGSRAAGHRWPVCASRRVPVVLVARTHARGLAAVRSAMGDCGRRALPVAVLGLVLMADAPGGLPRGLRDLKRLVSGGVPRAWTLPFVDAWRLGQAPKRSNSPKEAARLRDELRSALAQTEEVR